jgi:L-ascorbate metabolism protein UlaG (beta-lactamase superfamily)
VYVKTEEFDGFGEIFVTHGHFDQISCIPEVVKRNPDARVHCTDTPYRTLLKLGVPERNLRRIGYGDTVNVNGFTLTALHGRHVVFPKFDPGFTASLLRSPMRGNMPYILRQNRICRENDETLFYQIEAEGKRISLMGSMNLREDADYPAEADLLILPYNGWRDNYAHAMETVGRLKPKRILLVHYDDTFPPLTRPVDPSPFLRDVPAAAPMELGKAELL